MKQTLHKWLAPALALFLALPALAATSFQERLSESYLRQVRQDVRALRQAAQPEQPQGEYRDVRAVFHAHSALSHDSRGTEAQIVAAAKEAGVRAVFMTEHPTEDRRWQTEGLRGEKDGVLFVPGAELSDGLLIWRGEGADWSPGMKAGEALRRLQGTDAVTFIAHAEARKTDEAWDLPPFTGMEIYNSHADAADSDYEGQLAEVQKGGPLKLLSLVNTLKKYPREAFAAIFNQQAEVMRRWDTLNARFLPTGRRVVGIAGNDSHQNVGISVEAAKESLIVKDALGKAVGEVPKDKVPLLLLGTLQPGSVLLAHTFDPYGVSFGYVSTHLLTTEVTEAALFDAVRAGRAYVAFDWLANPRGFQFTANAGGRAVLMGGDARTADNPVLTVRANMPAEIRLLRNGEEVRRVAGQELSFEAREPGVYRAEVWVTVAGEPRPWIYSNPIYVTA